MATHKLEIRRRRTSRRPNYRVKPGTRRVRRRDWVVWKASGTYSTVLFPDTRLFGARSLEIPKDRSRRLRVTRRVEEGEKYPYAVFTQKDQWFAAGDTPPKIIIE